MAKIPTDSYTSQAIFDLTESAGNTLTFERLETGLSVYDKIAWVLSRVEWNCANLFSKFDTSGDSFDMALTMTNSLTTLDDANPAILIKRTLIRYDNGTAATGTIRMANFVDDFSMLPGGGIMILPSPLYCGIKGSGLSAAARLVARLFFKAVELSDNDYFNLVQSRQLLIST